MVVGGGDELGWERSTLSPTLEGRLPPPPVCTSTSFTCCWKLTWQRFAIKTYSKIAIFTLTLFFTFTGYNGVHISRVKSLSDTESNSPKITRARSKSAVTLSRGVVKVSEIVPAAPPRRASLGVLKRTNSNKSAGKCGLKALKESNSNSSSSSLSQSENLNVKNQENGAMDKTLSESVENFDDRTYMVLEPEPDHEYSVPNKSKFYVSAEKEDERKPAVRMTMRERLQQLTQSSEDEIDHTSDSDVSPSVDKGKSDLVKEIVGPLKEDSGNNIGQQQVVTLKFSADNGMLSAEGAQITTTGKSLGDSGKNSPNNSRRECKTIEAVKEPRLKIIPGTDAQGYTKLLHIDEQDNSEANGSSLESSRTALDSDSDISSAPTLPVRRSWVSRSITCLCPMWWLLVVNVSKHSYCWVEIIHMPKLKPKTVEKNLSTIGPCALVVKESRNLSKAERAWILLTLTFLLF